MQHAIGFSCVCCIFCPLTIFFDISPLIFALNLVFFLKNLVIRKNKSIFALTIKKTIRYFN